LDVAAVHGFEMAAQDGGGDEFGDGGGFVLPSSDRADFRPAIAISFAASYHCETRA